MISGAQEPEPQNKKWAFHTLCLYMYHNEVSFFLSYALRSGANHPASFFSSNHHGRPHSDITKFDEGMKKKCGGFIFICIFLFWFELLGSLSI